MYVKFGEIPFRPEERAEASGPEGDGEGLSSSSYWPPCAASEEVGRNSGQTRCLDMEETTVEGMLFRAQARTLG